MPKFYGYGRASTDKQVASPETQRDMITLEFNHQKAIGIVGSDMEWGGYVADGESRSVKFLHRPMGQFLALVLQKGDKLCVTALDRLLGSSSDAEGTIEFMNSRGVGLVIMDMRIDASNSIGQLMLENMCAFKAYERREIGRRTKEGLDYRRRNGLPIGGRQPPIGWQIKTIVPLGGGKPMKYYLPAENERIFCNQLLHLHEVEEISFRRLATKIWKEKIINPRTGKYDMTPNMVMNYCNAVKNDWPLYDGIQWKPPGFSYKVVNTKPIDFSRVSA